MKKIVSITVLLACLCMFNNCSDDAYNDKYTDPNKITELLMDKVMTGVFVKINDWAVMGYGRFYSYDNLYLANFTQSFGRPFSNSMYHNGWSDDGSGKYSSLLSATGLFKKLEMMYNELDDVAKPAYEAYYLTAKTHLYAYLLAMIDLYGDMPYTEGGMVAATGDIGYSDAHFDHAEDLYEMIITEMKAAGLRFPTVTKSKDFTVTSDFVNGADLLKWQKYANSICLRAAMRVAGQGLLSDLGRATVKEILEHPETYPVVDNFDDNILIDNVNGRPGYNTGQQGFSEGDGTNNRVSDDIVSRMLSDYDRSTWSGTFQDGKDDPRIALMYDLAVKAPYLQTGYPSYVDADGRTVTQSGVGEATVFRGATYEMPETAMESFTLSAKGISLVRYDGLFWNNLEWDHQIITSSEIWFIKAEAFQRGWANGDAKAAFKTGVKQSIEFYFHYHNIKTPADPDKGIDGRSRRGWLVNPTEPDAEWIDAFAEARWEAPINSLHPYVDKIDAIITQKYLHYGIFFVQEAWNDLRRTGYPSGIYFPRVSDATMPELPVRLRYPAGERDYNKNFAEVTRPGFNDDDFYVKLFWAK